MSKFLVLCDINDAEEFVASFDTKEEADDYVEKALSQGRYAAQWFFVTEVNE